SENVKLIAVSKMKPAELIREAYEAGQRAFGENKVQELREKQPVLPEDIEWHMIGHLQSNKVKYIAPYVYMIHAVDSFKLLKEINKRAKSNDRIIKVLLQIHIATEESKFGFNAEEVKELLNSSEYKELENIQISGLMGMATNTSNMDLIRSEFKGLKDLFDQLQNEYLDKETFTEISMGMSNDYLIAIEEGSTMVRIGTAIFGLRACAL
ncbi:MAG TPA: YggS family pyridoxal phosphate-dependent enzyme, partial [Bacteroidetes bacterium]|nr:YggS family pyridoxal phosphate-dependent enzyme [Bacteroidota bacterium]